jgi:hypothetical protein
MRPGGVGTLGGTLFNTMKTYHYDTNGRCTGHSEYTTFFEWLVGFAIGGAMAVLAIPLLIALMILFG